MLEFAKGDPARRKELFATAAAAMKVHPAILEKDFWVCCMLHILFEHSEWSQYLIFKGGTSLSKVFQVIKRFSEDIDLVLDWRLLGYGIDDPWRQESKRKRDKFSKDTEIKNTDFLANRFVPSLTKTMTNLGLAGIALIPEKEIVRIEYPRAFQLDSILPQILLEIGPLASWTPHKEYPVTPYAAQVFPQLFKVPKTSVKAVTAERTFWEKATILHQECNRPASSNQPKRYSRHYYDMYRLSLSEFKQRALADFGLLDHVIRFKEQFYFASYADLQSARPGTFKLIPSAERLALLADDYAAMQGMFFEEEVPRFEQIIQGLRDLEKEINT